MIKTKQPVLIEVFPRRSEVLYFDIVGMQEARLANFKGQVGAVIYLIRTSIMVDGKLKELRPPRQATYKLSTFNTLFGGLTKNELNAQEDELMIQQISYTANATNGDEWYGLTEDDLEIYNPQ